MFQCLLGAPDFRQVRSLNEIDLLGEPQAVHRHERVMSGIGGAAERFLDDHDAKADIHGIEHGREHADVGLAATRGLFAAWR